MGYLMTPIRNQCQPVSIFLQFVVIQIEILIDINMFAIQLLLPVA